MSKGERCPILLRSLSSVRNAWTLLCVVALGGVGDVRAFAEDLPGVRRTEDVIYGRKDGLALTLDVFQPAKANHCGIVYLVNGGWQSSKATPLMQNVQPAYYRRFLERGYTVFAVVTSSQPRYAIPDLMNDCQRAVRFIRTNATRFGVDPDRLGVTGSSSGGHLALSVATLGGPGAASALDPVDRASSQVQAVACFFPPTDFLNYGGPGVCGVGQGPLAPLRVAFGPLAETAEGRFQLGRAISPINHLTRALPPTLLIHGDADDVVPLQQSQSFVDRARSLGVPHVRLLVRPGLGHGWPRGSIVWLSDPDLRDVLDWFDQHLKP